MYLHVFAHAFLLLIMMPNSASKEGSALLLLDAIAARAIPKIFTNAGLGCSSSASASIRTDIYRCAWLPGVLGFQQRTIAWSRTTAKSTPVGCCSAPYPTYYQIVAESRRRHLVAQHVKSACVSISRRGRSSPLAAGKKLEMMNSKHCRGRERLGMSGGNWEWCAGACLDGTMIR